MIVTVTERGVFKRCPDLTPKEIRNFWNKVNITDTCWLWTASTRGYPNAYGCINYRKVTYYAHHVSWELAGHSLEGGNLLHICDVKRCVNPSHLYIGTQSQNIKDAVERGGIWVPTGTEHYASTISNEAVRKIRDAKLGEGAALARVLGIDRATVSRIRRRISRKYDQ